MTSSTARPPAPAVRTAGPSLRQLWQVPTFFLGLTALVVVGLTRPCWRDPEDHRLGGDLADARALLAGPESDPARAASLARRVLDQAGPYPQLAGEAHFLLGSALLRVAETAPQAAAPDRLRKARAHLEQAHALGVAEADLPSLEYRIGKALYLAEEDPRRVIELLARSAGRAPDDPGEGYAMLTQAYLRLPQPDFEAALEANHKQLQLPTDDARLLTPARFLRGELLLRKKEHAEALKVLETVRPPAPPVFVGRARFLRAAALQELRRWDEAARLWEEALADRTAPVPDPARARYWLGLCYRNLDRPREAARAWEDGGLWKDGSDEGTAAALGLAELYVQDGRAAAAVEALEAAVRRVKAPAEWLNSLVGLEQARATFARTCQALREHGDAERAVQAATLYERLAPGGTAAVVHADAAAALAAAREETAARVAGDVARQELRAQALGLWLQAGAKYESAAAAAEPAAQAARLWRAAECYLKGQNHAGAAQALDRFVRLEQMPEVLGQAWFLLAEARRALKDEDEALAAYERSLSFRGPFEFKARHELALLKTRRGAWDEAEAALKRNLKLLGADPDAEAQDKALFALGDLYFRRQNYQPAVFHLELALKQYPSSPRALAGRYLLAECYRSQAALADEKLRRPENQGQSGEFKAHWREQYQAQLGLAAAEYDRVAEAVLERKSARPMSPEDDQLLVRASFAAAQARNSLGQHDDALRLYKVLAARYQGRAESLYALAGVRQSCWYLNFDEMDPGRHEKEYREVLDEIAKLLGELPDSAFDPAGGWTRAQWQEYLDKQRQWDAEAPWRKKDR